MLLQWNAIACPPKEPSTDIWYAHERDPEDDNTLRVVGDGYLLN